MIDVDLVKEINDRIGKSIAFFKATRKRMGVRKDGLPDKRTKKYRFWIGKS